MKVGIIGGSGLDDPRLIENFRETEINTPYGSPSSPITEGAIAGTNVCILSRHGKKHQFPPTQVNYRANIHALKSLGCTHIIATTACGSLRKDIGRGDLVIPDQFIDNTKHRKSSFHEYFENSPVHTSMSKPFNETLRQLLIQSSKQMNFKTHESGTLITIEGPRFSTKAESKMFRAWGADIINMSVATEAILANEAQIPYAVIAMSTDYDCLFDDVEPVTWEEVIKIFGENADKVKKILLSAVKELSNEADFLIKSKIRTIPDFPKQGILFRDITTLLMDAHAMKKTIGILEKRYEGRHIDIIVGIESRGFILGGILSEKLNVGFVPVRKTGKLPAEKIREEYSLEYGTDAVEIHKDAIHPGQKILIIDDLLATGGTASASCNLIKRLGGEIEECAFVIELEDLGGRKKLEDKGYKVFSIIKYDKSG